MGMRPKINQSLFLGMRSSILIWKYIKHQVNSKNQFRIHSPFVFEFYEKILNPEPKEVFFDKVDKIRKEIIQKGRRVPLQDFGPNICTQLPNYREIYKIGIQALKPVYLDRILGRISHFIKAESIIEIGTFPGITTAFLSFYNPNSQVFSLEDNPELARLAQDNLDKLELKNVQVIQGNFNDPVPSLFSLNLVSPRFILIKGDHRNVSTMHYFREFLKEGNEQDVMVIDDIHRSIEMENDWNKIKTHEKVILSIDLFYFGIIFFRNNRAKEHFKIRLF